jgi:hypothetical protein
MDIQAYSKIIQPVYHNAQFRTTFDLGNKMLSSDLRLAGVKSTDPDKVYPGNVGAWSLVDKIYLYDGEILLSSNEAVGYWMAFISLNHSNSSNISKFSNAYRNKYGFELNSDGLYDFSGNLDFLNDSNTANDAWLNLKDVLWMLKYTPILHFQNLRLVIEWKTSEIAAGFTVQEPSLMCLEVEGKINMKPFEYYDVELDRSFIDVVANNNDQPVERNIDAFNGKIISRLLIGFQSPAGNSHFGQYSSIQQVKEQIQLYNSNIPITPSAITIQNKLAYLEGAWGTINLPTGTQFEANSNDSKLKIFTNSGNAAANNNVFLSYGWCGVDVDSSKPIINLTMKYNRRGGGILQHQTALNVYVFGLVKKVVGENKSSQAVVGDL